MSEKPKMRFRLLRGKYHENVPTGEVDQDGKEITKLETWDSKTKPIITSTTDLTKMHGRQKFEPLGRAKAKPVVEEEADEEEFGDDEESSSLGGLQTETDSGYEFEKMTVAELKAFADDEEIDVSSARNKPQIINLLTEALSGRS